MTSVARSTRQYCRGAGIASILLLCTASGQVPFARVAREISTNRQAVEGLIGSLDQEPDSGALLGPQEIRRLRDLIESQSELSPALAIFPGDPVGTLGRGLWVPSRTIPDSSSPPPVQLPPSEELAFPVPDTAFDASNMMRDLGGGLVVGRQADTESLSGYPASARLSVLLNRLSLFGAKGYSVKTPWGQASSPGELIEQLQENGHDVEVRDLRTLATLAWAYFKGEEIVAPYWIDTGIEAPRSGRRLKTPLTFSLLELRVNGPQLNATATCYFGTDGKLEFRPKVARRQGWMMGKIAHRYRDQRAADAIRLAAQIIDAVARIQRDNPHLPAGGYYALGNANDFVALVEQQLEGKTTLYPLTHQEHYFKGMDDLERLVLALPKDRLAAGQEDLDRIVSSLPVTSLAELPFPDVAEDLTALRRAAVQTAAARPIPRWWFYVGFGFAGLILLVSVRWVSLFRPARRRTPPGYRR